MDNEISRPLREELSEIKEILKSIQKFVDAIDRRQAMVKEILKSIQKTVDAIDRRQAMEDKVYDQWLGQYDVDISEPPPYYDDPEPYVPVAACSVEMQMEAMRKHAEWEERHGLR